MPGASAIGRDIKGGDALVGVDDLQAEPVGRDAFFIVNLEWRSDGAVDVGPSYVDDTQGGVCEGRKGVGKEIEVVRATAGTLIYDLEKTIFVSR